VSDVLGHEHPRPCADRCGEDRDVLDVGKLACPLAVVWSRPVDLDGNRAEELLEERRGFRKLAGQIPPNLPTAVSGRTKRRRPSSREPGWRGWRPVRDSSPAIRTSASTQTSTDSVF
jgi:hypothetical protein